VDGKVAAEAAVTCRPVPRHASAGTTDSVGDEA